MYDLLFTDNAAWFTIPAISGTAVFLLKLMFMLMFGGGDVDMDVGVDGDGSSSAGFQVLSVQSVAAFMMGFGWGGVAALHGLGLSWPVSALVGMGCGLGIAWVLALGLKGMHDLQTSGNIAIDSTVGKEGSVYITVPADGTGRGQVRLVVGNRARVYQAIAADGQGPLPTGTAVKIVKVNGDNTVTVARV